MKTSVSTKGRIVLPAALRRRDDIEPGQVFDVERVARGHYRLVCRTPRQNEGVVFNPIESESTDSVSSRS